MNIDKKYDIDHFYNLEYDRLSDRLFNDENNYLSKCADYNNINTTTSRCYTTSNEHLEDLKKYLDFKNKRVATVGSSGDQVLTALLNGSKNITLIDGNVLSRAFTEYKMAIIENLSFQETNRLLGMPEYFSFRTYRKISHSLSPEVRQLFDTLMLEQDRGIINYDRETPCAEQLNTTISNEHIFKNCDFYKNIDDYYKLQEILRKKDFDLTFKLSEYEDFSDTLEGKFDIILLSNIVDYKNLKKFEDGLYNLYHKNLNKNGTIQVNYRYLDHRPDVDTVKLAGLDIRHESVGNYNEDTVYFIDK